MRSRGALEEWIYGLFFLGMDGWMNSSESGGRVSEASLVREEGERGPIDRWEKYVVIRVCLGSGYARQAASSFWVIYLFIGKVNFLIKPKRPRCSMRAYIYICILDIKMMRMR